MPPVQRDAVAVLGGRDEEQGLDALQRAADALGVVVAAERRDLGVLQVRRARRVAHEQALRHAVVGEPPGDPPAEPAGRARHADAPAVHAPDPRAAAGRT